MTIHTTTQDFVTTITLEREEVHNAFNGAMIAALTNAFKEAADDDASRLVIIKASGKNFCAGGDLNWMKEAADYTYKENFDDARNLGTMLHTLYTLPKPTMALVQGAAYGGGVGLAAACDITLAATNARFCLSEVKLGLIPAVISPYVIKAMGERNTSRYSQTAEVFEAEEAHRMGLVSKIIESPEIPKGIPSEKEP